MNVADRVDLKAAEAAVRDLLIAIGEDPERPGVQDTPRRVAKFWQEFMEYDAGKIGTTFDSIKTDQMVVVTGMRVWSMCEHHLLPFWCDVSVGYLAGDRVLGLSKFGRVAKSCARRLQVQERLVDDIADVLKELVGHENTAVVAKGEHLCMVSRGIEMPHHMISSSMRGRFLDEPEARQEFLSLAGVT